MILNKAALNYAKGLFLISQDMSVLEDLLQVQQCLAREVRLQRILCVFDHSKADKHKLLAGIFKDSIDPTLLRFLSYLIEKGKFSLLDQIIYCYRQLILENAGILEATLITAMPISEEHKVKLASKLSLFYQKKVEIEIKVDPEIVAGAVLVIGNQMIDLSINTQLNHLTKHLLAAQI